jgi:hypothetical protein
LEQKAAAAVTLCLSLLAVALAIGGYQVGFVRDHLAENGYLLTLLLLPAMASIVFLVLATIVGLEVQRVGIFQWEGAEPLGRKPGGNLGLVSAEETGRRLAQWTARAKANGALQARAWLSRAIVALILSSVVTVGMASTPSSSQQPNKPSPASPTTSAFPPSAHKTVERRPGRRT